MTLSELKKQINASAAMQGDGIFVEMSMLMDMISDWLVMQTMLGLIGNETNELGTQRRARNTLSLLKVKI